MATITIEFTPEEIRALQMIHAPKAHLGLPVNWQSYEDAKRKILTAKIEQDKP